MNLRPSDNKQPQILFIQHKCQSGLDVWLDNLSKGLKNQGVTHQIQWLNHLAEPFPWFFTSSVSGQKAIIHTVPVLGKYLKKKCRHLVITVHHLPYDKEVNTHRSWLKRNYWNMIRSYEYAAFKDADRIISVSSYTQRRLKTLFGVDSEVIYQGVNTNLFRPKESPINASSKTKLKLFFIGNLSYRKGFDLLLKLSKMLGNNIEIRIACGLKSTRKTRYSRKDNILFLGRLKFNTKELISEYQNCNIFIATSRLEGLGIGLAEAMASGKPVVALNAGPTRENIDEAKGGYVIDNLNLKQMTEKIHYLRLHPELREQMGRYNRQKALTRFYLARFAQAYSNLFKSLI